MNAFIAWTPLHVINIINTAENYFSEDVNDIYIYDEFDSAKGIYEKLLQTPLFENVYYISHRDTGNLLEMGLSLLLNHQKFIDEHEIYTDIFIQGGNYFSKILYGETKKRNSHLRLHYIEDGIGAYIDSPVILQDTFAKKMIKVLNKYSMYNTSIEKYFVYEPDLVKNKKNLNYLTLPKLNKKNTALEIVKKIFSLEKQSEKLENKILFFDQPLFSDGFKINEINFVERLNFPELDCRLIVKLHPRSPKDKFKNIEVLQTSLPWELYCLTKDFNNVLLITIISTTAFTPYLMFGNDLPVVSLALYFYNKLKNEQKLDNEETIKMLKNVIEFIERFERNSNGKVYSPITDQELVEFIESKL